MNTTARAWKDPVFRATLPETEFDALPAHPVGAVEFIDMVEDETRGASSEANFTFGCCNGQPLTFRTCITCHGCPSWGC